VVEQGTHKPLVGGSNPPSATKPYFVLDSTKAQESALGRCGVATPLRLPADDRRRHGKPAGNDERETVSG
jgi:hypothetical protein